MADSEEQLIALLDQTCNPVSSTQLNAEKELNKLFEKSWEATLLALARIASSSEQSHPRRQLAQILVANQLRKGQSKYSKTKQEWRDSISKLLDNSPRAAVELAVLDDSLFDDHSLLSRLVKSCAELKPADVTKDSEPSTRLFNTLRIISGFCENGCSTLPERNAILTLVVNHIAAATACKELLVQLGDTLSAMVPFISHNLAIPAECKMIIVTLGKLSSHSDPDVRAKGVAGMTAIAEDHLKLLLPFMSAIFTVHTKILRAAENGPDTLQVLEFWTTVLERASDEDREAVVGPAAKELAIIILKDLIVWHEEGDDGTQSDQDEWNQRQAAGVLLSHLLSDETASPIVLPEMMAFAESHLASKDWSSRSATCLALGAWFAGCNTPEKIISMTAPVFTKTGPNSLWGLLEDPIPRVQEDAAWALAQVCQLGEDITEEVAAILVPNFTKSLSSGKLSPPAIASLCWGLSSLCSMYDESNTSWNASALSGDMQKIAELGMVLLQKTPDYRPQITDMVISLVRAIPSEGVALLNRMLSMYGAAAHSIVKAPQADPAIAWPLAPSLAIIAAIMQKEVVQQDSTKYFGPAMSMAGSAISFCRANPIDELSDCVADAFSIVTAMVPVAPASFQYQPLVTLALSVIQSSEDSLASKYAALLTLSEIATRGKEVVSPFALKIMQCVITLCASTQTPKTLKPPALHLIGDLVLAVESEVAPALPTVCQMLCGALDAVPDMMSDQENQEFVSDLMEAALDSVSSLALTAPADLLKPFAQTIVKLGTGTFKFFERYDPDHNDEPIFSKSINALFNCFADLDNKIGLAAQAPLFKSHASKFSLDPTISSRFWQSTHSGSGSLSVADDDSPSTPTIEEDM